MTHMVTVCPHCGESNDAVRDTKNRNARPAEGDTAICFTCGQWSFFDSGTEGGLRKPTDAEIKLIIMEDEKFSRMSDAWKTIVKKARRLL